MNGMRSTLTCPTCGVPVAVMNGDEGTCSYRPAVDAQPLAEFARWVIAACDLPAARSRLTLNEIEERAQAAVAAYEGFEA